MLKKTALILTTILMLLAFLPAGASATTQQTADKDGMITLQAAGETDPEMLAPGVTQIAGSETLLGVRGSYENVDADQVLDRINEIRREAWQEGLASTYVPIRWSDALEYIAQIRSAEASVKEDHVRPKGGYVFNMSVNNVSSYGENLAWGVRALGAVELWYSEKYDLVKNTGQETGHYEALIDPEYTHIGIGSFQAKGTWNSVCAEFTSASGISEERTGIYGDCIQLLVIPRNEVSLSLKGDDVPLGGTRTFTAKAGYNGTSLVLPEISWTSSDETVATVDSGVVTGVSEGTATITAELGFYGNKSGMTCARTIQVKKMPPDAPTISKIKKGRRTFTVTWEPEDQAVSYEVQFSLKKKMKAADTVDTGDATTLKVKGLQSGRTYFVRVRALNDAGASDWSKIRKVKVR